MHRKVDETWNETEVAVEMDGDKDITGDIYTKYMTASDRRDKDETLTGKHGKRNITKHRNKTRSNALPKLKHYNTKKPQNYHNSKW